MSRLIVYQPAVVIATGLVMPGGPSSYHRSNPTNNSRGFQYRSWAYDPLVVVLESPMVFYNRIRNDSFYSADSFCSADSFHTAVTSQDDSLHASAATYAASSASSSTSFEDFYSAKSQRSISFSSTRSDTRRLVFSAFPYNQVAGHGENKHFAKLCDNAIASQNLEGLNIPLLKYNTRMRENVRSLNAIDLANFGAPAGATVEGVDLEDPDQIIYANTCSRGSAMPAGACVP